MSLLEMAKMLGVNYLDDVRKGFNASFTSERFVEESLHALAGVIKDSIYKYLKSSPTFSLIIDGTIDVAVCKELIAYAKYVRQSVSVPHTEVQT